MGFLVVCVAIFLSVFVAFAVIAEPVLAIPVALAAWLYAGLVHEPVKRSRPIRWARRHI